MNSFCTSNETTRQFETEIILLVSDFGRLLGLPKSVCEIYGLLISVIEPKSMEAICARLDMSLGSVSQGLKLLKELGAVTSLEVEGTRREHFQAELNFRRIVSRYLNDKIQPRLNTSEHRFHMIESLLLEMPDSEQQALKQRLEVFRKLDRRAKQIVPAISRILSL